MLKSKKGFTAVDISISIIAIILFTSTILSLMYNVRMENLRMQDKLLATIYLTETLENIGIAEYEDVTTDNTEIIPDIPDTFNIKINVDKVSDTDTTKEDIIKKATVTISYKIGDKTYEESAERLKIKE